MSLNDQISTAMKDAMRAKESLTLDAVRMAKTALKNKEIEKMKPLTEQEGFAVMQTLIKQRQDSATQYRQGNREELAQKEEKEIEILRQFLPQALSDSELSALIQSVVDEKGKDLKQMGGIIKEVIARAAGRVEGGRVSTAVKQALSA